MAMQPPEIVDGQPVFKPSDPDLDRSYVALKPGNYKPREDLTPYKAKNLTEQQLANYKPDIPFGVGSLTSCVHVYPQGTIEVFGEVYCWNRLIKPGVYSRFEKIRYLDDEIVQPRVGNPIYTHHAVYNRITIPKNNYVVKRESESENIVEYRYVDFLDQIKTQYDGNVYPVPILNGTLTIYPDGTFITEGIVIKSDDYKTVDEYGYIGDQENYGKVKTWFNEVTLDPIDPRKVYKLISVNDDGSSTYGAITENESLTSTDWIRLPKGIIPINDGKVTINSIGEILIEGTVITGKGHRIKEGLYLLNDIFIDNVGKVNSVENPDIVILDEIWNPTLPSSITGVSKTQTAERKKRKVLEVITSSTKVDKYQYHYEEGRYHIDYIESSHGYVSTFLPMKGWDNFVGYSIVNRPEDTLDLSWLNKLLGHPPTSLDPVTDTYTAPNIKTEVYPFVSQDKFIIGNKYRYPYLRFNPSGTLDSYATLDHTLYEDFSDLTLQENNRSIQQQVYTEENGYGDVLFNYKNKQPSYETYASLTNDVYLLGKFHDDNVPKFIPFSSFKYRTDDPELNNALLNPETDISNNYLRTQRQFHGEVLFEQQDDKIYLTVSKNVILKLRGMYFTLRPGKIEITHGLIPEMIDEIFTGEVFNALGYIDFKHPLFTDKDKYAPSLSTFNNSHTHDDGLTYLDEKYGILSLLERNVTAYLTSYEKQLIDNTRMPVRTFEQRRATTKGNPVIGVDEHCGYYYGIPFTALDTRIGLSYYSRRFNSYIPSFFNAIKGYADTRLTQENVTYTDLNRILYFDRDKETASVYTTFNYKLHGFNWGNQPFNFSLAQYRGENGRDTYNHYIDDKRPIDAITRSYKDGVLTLGDYSLDPLSAYTNNLGYESSEISITYQGLPNKPLTNKHVSYAELFACPTQMIVMSDLPDLTQYNDDNPLPDKYQNYHVDPDSRISQHIELIGYYGHQIHYRRVDELGYMTDTVYLDNDHPNQEDTARLSPLEHQHNQTDTIQHTAWLDKARFADIKQKYGYIDFWLDNPFNEQISTHRVFTRRSWDMDPVSLIYPDYPNESVETDTEQLRVQGEPDAKYVLVELGNETTGYLDPRYYNVKQPDEKCIAQGKVDSLGKFKIVPDGLNAYSKYAVIVYDEYGVRRWTTFDVIPHVYKEGDFITPAKLFGRDEYFWPVNVRNKDNLPTELNLVDSGLTFDISDREHQTYTITGILRSASGNIYREGTYPIGTTPPMYRSELFKDVVQNFRGIKSKRGVHGYTVSTDAYAAPQKHTIYPSNTAVPINSQELNNEYWIVDCWNNLLPKTTGDSVNQEDIAENLALQLASSILNPTPSNRLKELNQEVYVGRYQNRIVFDGLTYVENLGQFFIINPANIELNGTIEPGSTTDNTLTPEGRRYRYQGYGFEEFFKSLSRDLPWWVDPTVNVVGVRQMLPWKRYNELPVNTSAIQPKGSKVIAFAVMNKTFKYEYGNRELRTGSMVNVAYTLNGYNVYTWHVSQLDDDALKGRDNCITYAERYDYHLDKHYDAMDLPMRPAVYEHWKEKGFDPTMFVFTEVSSTAWVDYSIDGETVTIQGRIKVGGRYTIPGKQTVRTKEEILFSNFCPNNLLRHNDDAVVDWDDDDNVTISGIVYRRDYEITTCHPTTKPSPVLKPNLMEVKQVSIDTIEGKPYFVIRTDSRDLINEEGTLKPLSVSFWCSGTEEGYPLNHGQVTLSGNLPCNSIYPNDLNNVTYRHLTNNTVELLYPLNHWMTQVNRDPLTTSLRLCGMDTPQLSPVIYDPQNGYINDVELDRALPQYATNLYREVRFVIKQRLVVGQTTVYIPISPVFGYNLTVYNLK